MSEHDSKPLPEVDLSKPPAPKMVRVTFEPENKTVEFEYGSMPYDGHGQPMSFLDVAENYGIFMDHSCGGVCACSTCHVIVHEGLETCNEATDAELDQLDEAPGVTPKSRLGCQCIPDGTKDIVVEIPEWNKNYAKELDGH